MFGIFYAVVMFFATIISGTKCTIEEHQQIAKAKEKKKEGNNKYNLYTDRKGATRDLDTGELRIVDCITCEKEGQDQHLRDIYGNPIRNLSMERRIERINEATKDKRRTVSVWKRAIIKNELGKNGNSFCSGEQYRDLATGDIYVCRMIKFPFCINKNGGYGVFYMDINTGLLVREADCQRYEREQGIYKFSEELNKKFIKYFNDMQKEGGYIPLARERKVSGWEEEESWLAKGVRLGAFYCNKNVCDDVPLRRSI